MTTLTTRRSSQLTSRIYAKSWAWIISKPYEGRDIKLRKRISESIQAKTFLSMLALLVVCCIIIYGMVMIFLPRNYHTELEGQVTSDFYDLVDILEQNGWEASSDSLLEFSMMNNASVEISDDIG